MKSSLFVLPILVALTSPIAFGQAAAPNKVGIINIQRAIVGTKDGQKAAGDLQAKFNPKKQEIEKRQSEIEALRNQLSSGSNTMNDAAKQNLMADIDRKTKALTRDTEDAQAELDNEQAKVMQELGQRIMAVIDKYAKDNGFSIILDVSAQTSPVLYAATAVDVTDEVIKIYDTNSPGPVTGGAKPASPAAKSAAPAKTPAAK